MPVYDKKEAVRHLSSADARLRALIERVGPCGLRPQAEYTMFYSLLRSILYQQLAGSAAAAILGRVNGLFAPPTSGEPAGEDRLVCPEHIVEASDELLRSAGVSRNKVAALRDLAAKTLDGTVPSLARARRMTEEELIRRLTQVRGIGQWTVEMLLIFRLGRPDILPLDDYGVRKGYKVAFRTPEIPTKKILLSRGERWRPYRSVASWYLWRAAELGDKSNPRAVRTT